MKSRQITVAEMAPHVHSFGVNENKVNKIALWLMDWIKSSLESGKVKPYDMLPSKEELAFHIGVSKGTMQNVFRYVEDCNFVESKQRVGTFIKSSENLVCANKLTSKRELAVEVIKKYLKDNDYKEGDYLISIRKLASETGISGATIRIAINSLITENILAKIDKVFVIKNMEYELNDLQAETLVGKIAKGIKSYLKNCKSGDKLPSNAELAKKFNVSIKTIHDAIKVLVKEGLLQTRRGRYGTIVANNAEYDSLYSYEKVELKIKNYISRNCEIGAKLPPITELAVSFNVSAKTIKKALDNLADEGFLTFSRGRYGGTFVTDVPQNINESYKWLALSSDYVENN